MRQIIRLHPPFLSARVIGRVAFHPPVPITGRGIKDDHRPSSFREGDDRRGDSTVENFLLIPSSSLFNVGLRSVPSEKRLQISPSRLLRTGGKEDFEKGGHGATQRAR